MSVWLKGLNPEQISAVQHNEGPLLVLAGAGSGKTSVLVARTGRLISDGKAQPQNICVLTFTNKAARELKHRVADKIGDQAKGLWAGTFHSFGLRILKENHRLLNMQPQFGVLDQSDSQAILRDLLKDIRVAGKDKFDLERLLNLIQHRRVRGSFRGESSDPYFALAELLLPKYLKRLDHLGAVDFEGLLLRPVELFESHPEVLKKYQERFTYMMVDEFQDTNGLQMRLIDLMTKSHRNLMVVGDDDQAIYGWRGAEVRHILDFPKAYKPCQVVRLEKNYRSSPVIVDFANFIISENAHRHGKVLTAQVNLSQTVRPELFVFEREEDEVDFLQLEIKNLLQKGYRFADLAVLYRSNTQGGVVESMLRQNQWPYSISGGTGLFDRKEVKDAMAYLRLCIAPFDLAARRVLNVPARGIGDTSLDKIDQFSLSQQISFWKALLQYKTLQLPEKAQLGVAQFFGQLSELKSQLTDGKGDSGGHKLLRFLDQIGYRQLVYQSGATSEAGEKKWISVEILAKILDRFFEKGGANLQSLQDFVEAMELRDSPDEDEENQISLMTLHASKGLEFPVVMLLGVEEDLLPHRTLGSDVSEERRLFYVGITRAQKQLIMTRCQTRKRAGAIRPSTASRFLLKIPKDMLIEYPRGVRPVSATERESLVSNFLSTLEQKSNQRPRGI